jgi:ribosomal protein S6--L-glutamate ligase
MHLTILSRGTSVHTTRRLVEAARSLGHRSRVIDPLQVQMGLSGKGPQLFLNDRALGRTDVVIPRVAPSVGEYGLALVNHFDMGGVAVLNDAIAIDQSRNKMRLMQLLAREGIRVPPTVIGRGASELKKMVDVVGGFPVAIKILRTEERQGIIICESAQSMEAVAETVLAMGHDIIVQGYVKPGEGRDLRALVVGGEVVAAVRRQPKAGKLHFNLSIGARVTRARLTKSQREMAIESARVTGLEVAAVDLLALKSGVTQVFEVYSNPGLRDLEAATGDDLALPIIERALALAQTRRKLVALNRPRPIDIRPRPLLASQRASARRV